MCLIHRRSLISHGSSHTKVFTRSSVCNFCSLPTDFGSIFTFVFLRHKYFRWKKFPTSFGRQSRRVFLKYNTLKSLKLSNKVTMKRSVNFEASKMKTERTPESLTISWTFSVLPRIDRRRYLLLNLKFFSSNI
ncbi:hypothetical protein PanWU01x14_185110 [Parasponia andersonii]|uniref:Uncharacterized protein n=1 Tax=Parasponia andersonii TaxID=3476 RepID=A0A2P5C444_PARAD|nr:hypothetical protein PanWU01x14_185110 [Parasponia andersonii]